jgi:hypothetical protein
VKRNLLSILALLIACCVVAPSTASAAVTVEQDVCSDPSQTAADIGFRYDDYGPFELVADCPDLKLSMWSTASRGEYMTHAMPVGADLAKVTATMSGGGTTSAGIKVRLRICSFEECGRALTAGTNGASQAGTLTLLDGIPANPVNLVIEAECTRSAGCSVQPDTVIRHLKLTYVSTDTVAPVVRLTDGWGVPYSDTTPMPIEAYDYVYASTDDGVEFWWTIDDGPPINTECSSLPDDPIPTNCGFFGMIRLPDFEGVLKLTAYTKDAGGNVGHASALLLHDSTPPAAPENLKVGDGDGWINAYEFAADWTAPTDPDITAAKFAIYDAGNNFVRGGTVEGAGVSQLQSLVSAPGKYKLLVRLVDSAGNESPDSSFNFRFDWIPPVQPTIDTIPVVNGSYVSSGLSITWFDTIYWDTSFSGVCNYRTAINSLAHYEPTTGPDVTMVPFSEDPSIVISPAELAAIPDGVRYFHVAGTSCAGVDGPASDASLVIDRKAPTVNSEPETGGWLAPGKSLVLRADDSDPGNPYAGVSTITYSVDGGATHTEGGPKVTLPISQGMHTVKFHADDVAGNQSAESTVQVGVDAQAPSAAFGAIDPADPALVRATVADSDSGVGDAWLEYRPPGSPTWARLVGSTSGDSPRELSARFPDDDSLPNGEYLLRIVFRDRAGNTGTTTTRVDGSQASLALPLRRHANLSLAVARSATASTSSSLTVPFGSGVVAKGTLRDPAGVPLVGAQVSVTQAVSGGQRKEIGAATTDAAGSFLVDVPVGPSRVLVANFRGDSLRGSASASATFNVRGSVTLKKLPKSVRGRKGFYLRGRVDPGLAALPKAGARVVLQHRSGKGWSGLISQKRTNSDGSFEFFWRQSTGGRSVRMTFRASVEPEEGWPYATGYSATRKVVVR